MCWGGRTWKGQSLIAAATRTSSSRRCVAYNNQVKLRGWRRTAYFGLVEVVEKPIIYRYNCTNNARPPHSSARYVPALLTFGDLSALWSGPCVLLHLLENPLSPLLYSLILSYTPSHSLTLPHTLLHSFTLSHTPSYSHTLPRRAFPVLLTLLVVCCVLTNAPPHAPPLHLCARDLPPRQSCS